MPARLRIDPKNDEPQRRQAREGKTFKREGIKGIKGIKGKYILNLR
jgi:hypothetical protein